MYIAVCDDQAEELSALTALLDQWQAERHFPLRYHTFRSAAGMLDVAQRERFSLYLLDVMMPGIDGMDAAREIRTFDDAADIVFLTSSPGFAYESYGVRALEYLLKPISGGLLFPVLDKLMLREQRPQDGLTLKAGATLVRVPFSRLSYVEVNGKHLYFHLADGTVREVAGSLKDYEPLLLVRPEFMRIHRSYIVNMLQIDELSQQEMDSLRQSEMQTAVYQHDMRHHLNMISGLLASGSPQQAQEYIQKVQSDVEAITSRRFCENETVNLLCSSFVQKAEKSGVTLNVDARVPAHLPISDTELCSLLSNALENALRAASTLRPEFRRTVDLYCGIRLNKLLIEVRNPYDTPPVMRDGVPVSDAAGHGFGCRSIQAIAQQRGGLCQFLAERGTFLLRVVLPAKGVVK